MLYILLISIFILSTYVFFVLYKHYLFLLKKDYEITEKYNSFENFKNTLRVVLKFYIKRFNKYYNFFKHYIEFIFIKSFNYIIETFDKLYKKMINRFLEKSIANKSYVKFFWKDLKNFKKEIDSKK